VGIAGTFLMVPRYSYFAPFSAAAIVLLAAQNGEREAIGTFVGAISFPMYLDAWIGGFIVNSAVKHWPALEPLAFLFMLAAAGAVGSVAYLLVDRNVMARRAGWYSSTLGTCAAIGAYSMMMCGLAFGIWTIYR
jgi:peptidoglycan/LPS O-acetylase OafA/YrhL